MDRRMVMLRPCVSLLSGVVVGTAPMSTFDDGIRGAGGEDDYGVVRDGDDGQ
jgi:hypothetical protein